MTRTTCSVAKACCTKFTCECDDEKATRLHLVLLAWMCLVLDEYCQTHWSLSLVPPHHQEPHRWWESGESQDFLQQMWCMVVTQLICYSSCWRSTTLTKDWRTRDWCRLTWPSVHVQPTNQSPDHHLIEWSSPVIHSFSSAPSHVLSFSLLWRFLFDLVKWVEPQQRESLLGCSTLTTRVPSLSNCCHEADAQHLFWGVWHFYTIAKFDFKEL